MMVVGVVAILFVGPRELPGMLRTAGQMIRKVRGLAGDFQRQMDDALREAELDGLKDSVNQVRNLNPTKAIKDSLNPLKADLEKTQSELAAASEPSAKFSTEGFRKKDPAFAVEQAGGGASAGSKQSDTSAKPVPESKAVEKSVATVSGAKSEAAPVKAPRKKATAPKATGSAPAAKRQAPPSARATGKTKAPARKPSGKKATAKKPAVKTAT